MLRSLRVLSLVLPVLLVSGCDENDAVSIRVRMRDDGGGTLTTSGVLAPAEPTRVESAVQGVKYDARMQISGAAGQFTALEGVQVSDIRFAAGGVPDGLRYVSVTIPQGAVATWPDVFVPLDEAARLKAAGALDPSGKSKDVGSLLKIEVELIAPVISSGLTGRVRGTKASFEGNVATLVLPIQAARGASEPLVWHITWQK